VGLAFSPDGKIIASASHEKSVRLWESGTGLEVGVIDVDAVPLQPWFSDDSKSIIVMPHGMPMQVWSLDDAPKPRFRGSMLSHVRSRGPVEFSPDRKKVAQCYNFPPENSDFERGSVVILDVATGRECGRLPGRNDSLLERVVFSPDGKKLATGGDDKEVRIWDLTKRGFPTTLMGHEECVMSLAFSSTGGFVATGDYGGSIKLWDLKTGAIKLSCREHGAGITGIVFTPDDKMMITSSLDRTLKIWSTSIGK
jgi:WD40 repeat protein